MADDFKALIAKVATGAPLTRDEAASAFDRMMSGEATPSQMGGLLMALRVRGETVDEITGAVSAMRAKMLRVKAPADAVDVVGTGGDGSGSVNVSTCASFIVAGAGVPVAKHGNRALSSRAGAADVLSSLGVRIDIKPEHVGRCVAEAGIGFMFAPSHHPAMKNVGPTRVELATRTIFNLLGPLSNPAGVKRQMVGVFSRQWVQPLAQVLKNLGAESVWVVHGSDGLDEITLTGPTFVAALENANIRTFEVRREEAGLTRVAGDERQPGCLRRYLKGADITVLECGDKGRAGEGDFIEAVGAVHHPDGLGAEILQHLRQRLHPLPGKYPDHLPLYASRIGQRPQQIEDRAGRQFDAGRADVLHGGMVRRREHEAYTGLGDAAADMLGLDVDPDPERRQHVRRARARRTCCLRSGSG